MDNVANLTRNQIKHAKFREKDNARSRAWYATNKEVARAQHKVWYQANKAHIKKTSRAYYLRRAHGISDTQYDAMALAQDYKCGICQKRKPLHVDHNHKTGIIRGLLCGDCNRGVGLFFENIASLREAIAWLKGPSTIE